MKDEEPRADRELDRRIGDVLRSQRLARRVSKVSLGRDAGVAYQQIRKYETGANRIPSSTLYGLAKVLRCSVGVFFEGIDRDPDAALIQPTREDIETARALDRIEDHAVRDALCRLIEVSAREAKDN